MQILVIEDDATVLTMVVRMLSDEGYSVLSASDGNEGMRTLEDNNGVSLVITDLIMPNKEGIETILDVKKLSPNTKILAMSGGGRGGANTYLSAAKSIGADGTLTKPFLRQELIDAVRALA